MAGRLDFIDDGRGLLFTGAGTVTARDVIAVKQDLLRQERAVLEKIRYAVVSFAETTTLDITGKDVYEVVQLDRRIEAIIPHLCVALVAPRPHDFGIARMWQAVAGDLRWSTHVFHTREEADAWLKAQNLI